jgi:hypothetical protein
MTKPILLSGDNPQIPKGYGDAPVAAWLAAVPDTGPGGWKHAACRRIDAVVSAAVPGVRKAVKWNSLFYAAPVAETRDHFFVSFHCFARYLKVTFLRGADLSPPPPEGSKIAGVRYFHVREGDEIGEQFADWVRQAAALPGVKM